MPKDWYIDLTTHLPTAATIIATTPHAVKGYHYVDCDLLEPQSTRAAGLQIQMLISHRCLYEHNICRLLTLLYDNPHTLGDIGITPAAAARVVHTLAMI